MVAVGSGDASAQFSPAPTATAIGNKIPPPVGSLPNTPTRYTIQGTFSGTYPAGYSQIAGQSVMYQKSASNLTMVPNTMGSPNAGLNPAGALFIYPSPAYPIPKPPVVGDDYIFRVSWRLYLANGTPRGLATVTDSALTTVLP